MEKLLLTVPEAAQRLSLSRSRVYELMVEGHEPRFPVVRIGRAARVPVKALEAWVDHHMAAQGISVGREEVSGTRDAA